ncbi:MAG: hypothetical protein H6672_08125 [Anaerolineaceae bacterium]|nr:hypothetical protein [Anaerolineaceae bacterium]
MNLPSYIALSERIYRILLVLYPPAYRREYGPLMVQFFRDVSRERYHQQGFVGVALWWCMTLLDLTYTVIEQRRKVNFTMSKSTLAQSAGMLLVVGGWGSIGAAFSQLQPGDHTTYTGLYQALTLLFVPSFLFVGLGCIGLGLRYDESLGAVGQWMLFLSGIGAVVMALGGVVTAFDASLRGVYLSGGILHGAALTAFGLFHVWKPILPIFRALPLQLASGLLLLLLDILQTGSGTLNHALAFLLFLGVGLVWLAIGLAVNRQPRDTTLVAA